MLCPSSVLIRSNFIPRALTWCCICNSKTPALGSAWKQSHFLDAGAPWPRARLWQGVQAREMKGVCARRIISTSLERESCLPVTALQAPLGYCLDNCRVQDCSCLVKIILFFSLRYFFLKPPFNYSPFIKQDTPWGLDLSSSRHATPIMRSKPSAKKNTI